MELEKTPYCRFNKIPKGYPDWDKPLNDNFDIAETILSQMPSQYPIPYLSAFESVKGTCYYSISREGYVIGSFIVKRKDGSNIFSPENGYADYENLIYLPRGLRPKYDVTFAYLSDGTISGARRQLLQGVVYPGGNLAVYGIKDTDLNTIQIVRGTFYYYANKEEGESY